MEIRGYQLVKLTKLHKHWSLDEFQEHFWKENDNPSSEFYERVVLTQFKEMVLETPSLWYYK